MQNKKSGKIQVFQGLLTSILLATLVLSGCAKAPAPKVYHVGVLIGLNFVMPIADGFKAGMTELGYIEGKNITYDIQATDFDMAKYKSILQKFVADKVDLIFVSPTEAAQEAKAATQGTGIPVVFSFAFTEGMGIIDTVRAPGGNITGVRFPGVDIAVKRFEILRELLPNAKRIWLPYQRGYPIVAPQVDAVRPLAEAAGITITEFPADNAAQLKTELDKRAASQDVGMDAIFFVAEPLAVTTDAFTTMAEFSYAHNIPMCGAYFTADNYRSLYGVNVDFVESGRLAAPLADKIFKGTQAGTIPAVSPGNFIQIDTTVAQRFGISVPEGLLKQADQVIH